VTDEQEDIEYRELQEAQLEASGKLVANNYRMARVRCCLSCQHAGRMSIEDSLECSLVKHERWSVADVYDLYVCDKYEELACLNG
jgi:hypothetical protein